MDSFKKIVAAAEAIRAATEKVTGITGLTREEWEKFRKMTDVSKLEKALRGEFKAAKKAAEKAIGAGTRGPRMGAERKLELATKMGALAAKNAGKDGLAKAELLAAIPKAEQDRYIGVGEKPKPSTEGRAAFDRLN